MEQCKLKRKYGLITAITVVVGTVIGSGIFFKAEEITYAVGSNLWLGILAWIIGGGVIIVLAYVFATLAGRHEQACGLIDYSDALLGKKYGYYFGWYIAVFYYPLVVAVLTFVAANFTVQLFNISPENARFMRFGIAAIYMVMIYVMNVLSPKIAGKFAVSQTVIKLIPIGLVAIVGFIWGVASPAGYTVENIQSGIFGGDTVSNPFYAAIVATIFTYAGWETALSLNTEIKNSKKNLPIAMVAGAVIITVVYILYYVGLFGSTWIESLMGSGGTLAGVTNVFGRIGGPALHATIVLSCVGSASGCSMAYKRGFYNIALRGEGPKPDVFIRVDKKTDTPNNSAVIGLGMAILWLFMWGISFGPDRIIRLPLPTLSVLFLQIGLIPIIVGMIIKQKDLKWYQRFLAPIVGIIGILFMVTATIITEVDQAVFPGIPILAWGLIVLGVMIFATMFAMKSKWKRMVGAVGATIVIAGLVLTAISYVSMANIPPWAWVLIGLGVLVVTSLIANYKFIAIKVFKIKYATDTVASDNSLDDEEDDNSIACQGSDANTTSCDDSCDCSCGAKTADDCTCDDTCGCGADND